ncbi:MAG: phosphoribosylaminoimidazolesuccinocarboxamide synthase [Saprospiraceae bacterium]|nr:phosphoribosylaminoimidazolesuccinocarboxamide synthase [Saprospiraceae bacterium]
MYHGKVRDVYDLGDKIIMIATDRISAFDHILPKPIPYKGQVLNQIARHFLDVTKDIVPNWLIATPDPNVSIGLKAESIKIEMVIRGYLAGHAWRTYKSVERLLCGVRMPDGLKENDRFPVPIITPTTKASEGHDMDISVDEILSRNIVSKEDWDILESYTRALFEKGSRMANERGLILVDTKYEFGKVGDKIILIDEIHTPDSSRYFYLDGYQKDSPITKHNNSFQKEFVREWLIQNNFQGLDGQKIPDLPLSFVEEISGRYIKLYEIITGQKFEKADTDNIEKRIKANVNKWLKYN